MFHQSNESPSQFPNQPRDALGGGEFDEQISGLEADDPVAHIESLDKVTSPLA